MKYRIVFVLLLTVFAIYNVIIYRQENAGAKVLLSNDALEGEKIWQENNCMSCHQLYGLGGYLGPDLTNVISNPQKGENYVKAFLNSGVKSMPKFNFSSEEQEKIVAFLKHVDMTGFYPNENAEFSPSGWVSIQYK